MGIADQTLVRIEHNYSHNCPAGYCQARLSELSTVIKEKEQEIEDLQKKINSLVVQRSRMTLCHIQENSEKVWYTILSTVF